MLEKASLGEWPPGAANESARGKCSDFLLGKIDVEASRGMSVFEDEVGNLKRYVGRGGTHKNCVGYCRITSTAQNQSRGRTAPYLSPP